MKVGDKVYHKKDSALATVIRMTVDSIWDDFKQRVITKTEYVARRDDNGFLIKFYGYDIGKTIFKSMTEANQTSFLNNNI